MTASESGSVPVSAFTWPSDELQILLRSRCRMTHHITMNVDSGLEVSGLTVSRTTELVDAVQVIEWDQLADRTPTAGFIDGVDVVVVRWDEQHSVLSGRCRHRGALLADGHVAGANLICGVHGWDYRMDTGVSSYDTSDRLRRFRSKIIDGGVYIDRVELADYRQVEGLSLDGPVD